MVAKIVVEKSFNDVISTKMRLYLSKQVKFFNFVHFNKRMVL